MDEFVTRRRFCVHGLTETATRGHVVEASSFEDAALCFAEDQHPVADADEVSLMVEDLETGVRQCFTIDLATGETAPCA